MRTSPLLGFTVTTAMALTLSAALASADIKRTASGHPDLSGTYNVATLTPLQRPKRYGDKLTITPKGGSGDFRILGQ